MNTFTFQFQGPPTVYKISFVTFSPVAHSFTFIPRSTIDYHPMGAQTTVKIAANTPLPVLSYVPSLGSGSTRIDFQTTFDQQQLYIAQLNMQAIGLSSTSSSTSTALLVNPSSTAGPVYPVVVGKSHYDLSGNKINFPLILPAYSSVLAVINGTADDYVPPPTNGQSTTDQSTTDQSTTGQSTNGSSTSGPSTGDQSTSSPSTNGQSTTSQNSPAALLVPSSFILLLLALFGSM
eukprot:Phypoly_transcript_17328.p1 GENE.Phypoly_transcript_17328~~Phypoly_transcript_17328.p1  ORF type:complete len:264 (+),score=43.06 Phypoly_transcript_17328:93-794(+)